MGAVVLLIEQHASGAARSREAPATPPGRVGGRTDVGFDTAVGFATECIDRLFATATSHGRLIVAARAVCVPSEREFGRSHVTQTT